MTLSAQTAAVPVETAAVDLVKLLFEAFNRGDIPYILDHITDDCRWISPGKGFVALGGEYHGPSGVKRFFETLAENEKITRFEPREFFANGDDVVVLGMEEMVSVKTGRPASANWSMLFRVRGGKIAFWEQLYDTALYAEAHKEGL